MTNDHEFLADEISRTSGCAHWGSYGRCEASESEHFAAQPETQPTSSTLKQRLVDYYNENNHRTDSKDAGCTHTSGWHKEGKPCFNCGEKPASPEELRQTTRAHVTGFEDCKEAVIRILCDLGCDTAPPEHKSVLQSAVDRVAALESRKG